MYYVYMIGSVIVSLVLIGAACSIPIFIIREFDKITYIKGYRHNLKWYKLPILLLYKVSAFGGLLLALTLSLYGSLPLVIMILISFATQLFNRKKRRETVHGFRVIFVTPILGMGLTKVLINGISEVLYYLEFNIISIVFNVICNALPYVIITYYVILIFKQFQHLLYADKIQLFDYREFRVKDIKYEDWAQAVLNSERAQEYLENYLLIYKNESEWNESEYNVLNYGYFCLLLFKLFSIVTILNFILFFIGGTIYGSGNYTLNEVRLSMMMSITITSSTIIILLLNWLFNKEIILSFKNKVKLTAKNFAMFFLSVIIGAVVIGVMITSITGMLYKYETEQYISFNYNDFKNYIVHKVEVNRDYVNYNDYDKLEYIFKYPQYFTDDVETLGYEDDYVEGNPVFGYNIYTTVDNNEFIEFANNHFGEEHVYNLVIGEKIYPYVWININDNNNTTNPIFDRVNINEDNRQNLNREFKTEEEAQLGLLMKEEALKVSNSVWDEEMKDRGLI